MSDILIKTVTELKARIAALEAQDTGRFIGCRVYNSNAITIANAAATALSFNSERFDSDAMHSTVSLTRRITSQIPGKYIIGGHVRWQANSTGYRELRIRVNAATAITWTRTQALSGALNTMHVLTTCYFMTAGSYAELMAYQNSGGNLTVQVAGDYSPEFWAVLAR